MTARLTLARSFLSIVGLAFLLAASEGQEPPKDKVAASKTKLDPKLLDKLIEQLKSDDFKTRDLATQELSKLDDVPDALRAAAKSEDIEVRRRAETVINRITKRLEEEAFKAMVGNLDKIELDRFIRRMITDDNFRTDKHWDILQTVVKAVTKRAQELGGEAYPVPDFDMKSLPMADLAKETVSLGHRRVLLQYAEPRRFTTFSNCAILCTGQTPRTTSLSNSILIVDGDLTGANGVDNSLLIVRGNVGRVTSFTNSIIIATGEMVGATGCDKTFVQVNNHQVRFTVSTGSVFIKTAVKTTGATTSRTVETDKGPLQLLKFSERKKDAQLDWGKEVDGLAVAIAPTDQPDKILVRWKNVGKNLLELPWERFKSDPIDQHADALLGHVFLKGPDGKIAPARRYNVPNRAAKSLRRSNVILAPGQSHEEIIVLWAYVDRPTAAGKYQLSIELDNTQGRGWEREATYWKGRIQSNVLEIPVGKQ